MTDFKVPLNPGEKLEFFRESKSKPRWRKYFLIKREDGNTAILKKRYGTATDDWKPGTSELELALFLADAEHPAVKELKKLIPEHL